MGGWWGWGGGGRRGVGGDRSSSWMYQCDAVTGVGVPMF